MQIESAIPKKRKGGNPAWTKGKSGNPRGRQLEDKTIDAVVDRFLKRITSGSQLYRIFQDLSPEGQARLFCALYDKRGTKKQPEPAPMERLTDEQFEILRQDRMAIEKEARLKTIEKYIIPDNEENDEGDLETE